MKRYWGWLAALICSVTTAGCGTPSFLITPVANISTIEETQVQPGSGFGSPKIALIELDGMLADARVGGIAAGLGKQIEFVYAADGTGDE